MHKIIIFWLLPLFKNITDKEITGGNLKIITCIVKSG